MAKEVPNVPQMPIGQQAAFYTTNNGQFNVNLSPSQMFKPKNAGGQAFYAPQSGLNRNGSMMPNGYHTAPAVSVSVSSSNLNSAGGGSFEAMQQSSSVHDDGFHSMNSPHSSMSRSQSKVNLMKSAAGRMMPPANTSSMKKSVPNGCENILADAAASMIDYFTQVGNQYQTDSPSPGSVSVITISSDSDDEEKNKQKLMSKNNANSNQISRNKADSTQRMNAQQIQKGSQQKNIGPIKKERLSMDQFQHFQHHNGELFNAHQQQYGRGTEPVGIANGNFFDLSFSPSNAMNQMDKMN